MLRGLTAACTCLAAGAIAASPVTHAPAHHEPETHAPAPHGVTTHVPITLDRGLPYYEAGSRVSGSITSIGSDTMDDLMNQWFERYERYYPNVIIEIESNGSATAIPALIEGVAQFGPMSRDFNHAESNGFERRYGYEPKQLSVAIDALAIFVNENNPLDGLTLTQVEQVFSVKGEDMTWGDLGLTGEWANKPVALYGRNSGSAAFGFFKEVGLNGAEFKPGVTERPGSETVVRDIANNKYAMGYSGMGYATDGVRVLPLAFDDVDDVFVPSVEATNNGDYPLTRNLYLTINHRTGVRMPRNRAEFFKLIYSKQGQEIVINNGYYPVNAETARKELLRIGIELGS